ncbi:putative bifunctional diguanylate cyclase/phosphodiesterase [Rhizomonospora bruguierae]|uniref:putative bifunctional diguanylate cyclase/phosphodiesterase n=1 Tax=Rhizomonospora bruguierae TaxID=1581705 RepID=UPI001BCAF433|nr:bifunctional diguanylate cyclase/phosphodiesterase [Micromonospora sp. NBRC 107566]
MPAPKRPIHRPQELSWLITAPLALLAGAVTAAIAVKHADPVGRWPLAAVFLVVLTLAHSNTLRLEVRRHSFTASLVDVPFLLALFYLPPVTLLVIRLLASILSQIHRKVSLVKICFNTANVAAYTALASAVVYWHGPMHADEPSTWLTLAVAVSVGFVVTAVTVVGVIALVQGTISPSELTQIVVPAILVGVVNTTVALVILIVLAESAWSVIPLTVLVTFFVVVYRSYSKFLRQHRTLTEIYDLTRAIADTPHDGTLVDVLLGRVRQLLQAEYATLWLPAIGRYPEVLLSSRQDDRGLVDVTGTPDVLRRRVLETGQTVAVGLKMGEEGLRAELRAAEVKDAIAVPLKAGSAVIGSLEVAGRLGDAMHFTPADARLLETIAAHAAVAVENSRLVDRLRFDAYHDSLTGLANRRRVLAALEESVAVRAPGEVVAVLQFDVDGMQDVNDSLGYSAGDKLLTEVAGRLKGLAAPAALVGRVGGDEFVVTLRTEGAEEALEVGRRLREQLREPMTFDSLSIDVDTAVGVTIHPDHGSEPATLLQRVDLATQAAKAQASRVQLFNPALESRSVRRLSLAADLRRALDGGEIEVHFQPKVSLCDRSLVGVECLARWEHPTYGSVAPEDFVAVAEHTGQLGELTEAVLKAGLRRCRSWGDAGRPLSVAVNLSGRTLTDADFPDRVAALLAEYGVPAQQLTFEITESGVVGDAERPIPTLHRLHEIGVRLSVDDFGTGYSSLSFLRRLPVDEVKIDQTFVQGMTTDEGDLAIVRAVVGLARHFGLTVVAEGVESELSLELLGEIGCDVGQGFLFSRPLPFERLEAWFGVQTEAEPTPAGLVRRLRAVP